MAKEKILLDTDIGSDIDDAVCLAYLLMQPACDLLGITTVSGEPVRRARLCDAILQAAGRDVPVYPGAEFPLLTPIRQPAATQADALSRWPHKKDFPEGEAIPFLYDTIRKNPGEVTLLAIGPMTNVALLFAEHPDAAGMLKALVLMCGVFTNKTAGAGPLEWNALNDPYATAMVYAGKPPVHRSIGLDVTCRVRMDAKEVAERFTHPVLKPVYDFAQIWFERAEHITFHDPLAATTIFDGGICGFERGNVEVALGDRLTQGLTHFVKNADGRHEAALEVDAERFFGHYFGVFK